MHDVSANSLQDFLTSIGMPMYMDIMLSQDLRTLDIIQDMEEGEWRQCGITDPRHLRRLVNAVEILRIKLEALGRTNTLRNVSHIRDKV